MMAKTHLAFAFLISLFLLKYVQINHFLFVIIVLIASLLPDIDLAILGSESKVFNEYEQKIREEYSFVNEEEYRTKRSIILKQFLNRKTIYFSEYFRNKYEKSARRNLEMVLTKFHINHQPTSEI